MKKQVSEKVKDERLQALQALLLAQQDAFNDAQIGRVLPVLFEKPGRNLGQVAGRTPYLQPVYVEGDEGLIGHVSKARIAARTVNSLKGALV